MTTFFQHDEPLERALMHNHIFQPKKGEPTPTVCPACQSIDPERMTTDYVWEAKFAVARERMEKELSQ